LLAFLFFDALPVALHLPGVGDAHVAKHMGMTPHQLAVDAVEHVSQLELPGFPGDVSVESHLHQQVPQLLGQ
jgi:hypothetical protein